MEQVQGELAVTPESRYRSRKFLLAMATLVIASLLVAFKFISDGSWASVVITVGGAYMASNVWQKKLTEDKVLS